MDPRDRSKREREAQVDPRQRRKRWEREAPRDPRERDRWEREAPRDPRERDRWEREAPRDPRERDRWEREAPRDPRERERNRRNEPLDPRERTFGEWTTTGGNGTSREYEGGRMAGVSRDFAPRRENDRYPRERAARGVHTRFRDPREYGRQLNSYQATHKLEDARYESNKRICALVLFCVTDFGGFADLQPGWESMATIITTMPEGIRERTGGGRCL